MKFVFTWSSHPTNLTPYYYYKFGAKVNRKRVVMMFKVIKQTTVGSGWGSEPDDRRVGAVGCVKASYGGDPVGQGVPWPLALNGLPPSSLNLHPAPPSPSPAPGQWCRKHQGNTKPRRLLDLVTLKPATWTRNPRPVFHSISPTITCNTCLLTRWTEAGVYVNVYVFKRDGGPLFPLSW